MATTFIRKYKNMNRAQTDMARLGVLGFEAVSTSQLTQNVGCLRFLLLGWLSLIFKPKPHIMVTYRGEGVAPMQPREPNVLGWLVLWPLWVWSYKVSVRFYVATYRWAKNTLVPWTREVAIPWAKAHPIPCGVGAAVLVVVVIVANVAH